MHWKYCLTNSKEEICCTDIYLPQSNLSLLHVGCNLGVGLQQSCSNNQTKTVFDVIWTFLHFDVIKKFFKHILITSRNNNQNDFGNSGNSIDSHSLCCGPTPASMLSVSRVQVFGGIWRRNEVELGKYQSSKFGLWGRWWRWLGWRWWWLSYYKKCSLSMY